MFTYPGCARCWGTPMRECYTGLMLPLKRKSVEPIAAHVGPQAVSAKHQSLLHFVGNSTWSDEAILRSVHDNVMERVPDNARKGWVLVVDDTGYPKQGCDLVGVARQYCGMLGKTDNFQVAVSVSKANAAMSLPLAYRLYRFQEWVKDAPRRQATKVPPEVGFATKPQIALEQLAWACEQGMAAGVQAVLADSAYGTEYAFGPGIARCGVARGALARGPRRRIAIALRARAGGHGGIIYELAYRALP